MCIVVQNDLMEVLFRNFPETANSKIWGLSVFSFGELIIPPDTDYPIKTMDKDAHHFWQNGRMLQDSVSWYILVKVWGDSVCK